MKRSFILLGCLIASLLLIFAFGVSASAEETTTEATSKPTIVDSGSCGDNVTYTLDSDGLLTINGTGKMKDYEGDDDNILKSNSPWADKFVESVVISRGVTTIGNYAFWGCTGLINITIPDTVTSIGEGAFLLSGLGNAGLVIPYNVITIGGGAFPAGKVLVLNPDCAIDCEGISLYDYLGLSIYYHSGGKVEETVPSGHFVSIHIGENFDTYKCTDIGKRFQKCKYCDETASVDDVPFLGHTIVYEKKESTCTEKGYEKLYCKDCGYTAQTDTLSAKGHDKVNHNGKTATCTEDGYKAYVTCSRCGYTTKQVIPALGHDFSGPSRTNDDGTISYMCVNCGEYSTATIKDITGTKRLTQDNVDVLVAPVEMTASTVLASASGGKIADKDGNEITDKNTYLATGMKVILGKTSVTISVAGDVDGSGTVGVSDARFALRAAVKLDALTAVHFISADVDFDGDITVTDARIILRAAVELDDPKNWIE